MSVCQYCSTVMKGRHKKALYGLAEQLVMMKSYCGKIPLVLLASLEAH